MVQVSRDDYNVLLSRRVKKKLTYDPYILVFDTVITEVLRWMYFLPEGEQVTMCFHNSSFEARARRIYKRRQQRDPQGDRLADDLLFLSDDDLPIQAADILASLARNFLRGKVSGGLPITFRVEKYLSLLGKMTPTNWRVITAEQLKK